MVGRLLSANTEKNENKLTAAVFSTLLHLPDEEFWEILKKSCYNNTLPPEPAGTIGSYEFWPRWSPNYKGDKSYVEPDLFIRFEKIDIIIEAKRWDKDQQDPKQWNSEYLAYKKKYGLEKVALIAVGGLNPLNLLPEVDEIIQKCHWRRILDILYSYLQKYEQNKDHRNKRIIKDCIEYLEYFNFRKLEWLKEMKNIPSNICQHDAILDWLKLIKQNVNDVLFISNILLNNNCLNIHTNSINYCLQWRIS